MVVLHNVQCPMKCLQLLTLTHFMCVLLQGTSGYVRDVEALLSVLMGAYQHHLLICAVHVLKNAATRITMEF